MTNIKQLQREEFKILKRIDAFCTKHSINYFLYSGTLIGAVRHQAFIPWDDDIDIAMLRADFNKFDDFLAAGIFDDQEFYYQSNRVQPFYLSEVVKVRTSTFDVSEIVPKTQTGFNGPWVDVFPLDNVPDDKDLRIKQYNQLRKLNNIINFFLRTMEQEEDRGLKRFYKKTIRKINERFYKRYFFLKRLFKKRYELITKYNHIETKAVGSLCYMSYPNYESYAKCIIPKADLEEFIRMPFKSEMFLVPKAYEKILTRQYGSFMEIPKPNDRAQHPLIYNKGM